MIPKNAKHKQNASRKERCSEPAPIRFVRESRRGPAVIVVAVPQVLPTACNEHLIQLHAPVISASVSTQVWVKSSTCVGSQEGVDCGVTPRLAHPTQLQGDQHEVTSVR